MLENVSVVIAADFCFNERRMIFSQMTGGRKQPGRSVLLAIGALALTGCLGSVDDSVNSHLTQPAGATSQTPVEAGDIAIAGQNFAKEIRNLPEVVNAPKPPMVQFTGVTSVVVGKVPVDTDPYTQLLRDRLVLGGREKLRFIERELPPLVVAPPKKAKTKSKKDVAPPVAVNSDPDYQVLAELRGNYDGDLYKIQMQFVDFHTGAVLFNGLYRIRKEIQPPPSEAPVPASQPAQEPSPAAATGGSSLQ